MRVNFVGVLESGLAGCLLSPPLICPVSGFQFIVASKVLTCGTSDRDLLTNGFIKTCFSSAIK